MNDEREHVLCTMMRERQSEREKKKRERKREREREKRKSKGKIIWLVSVDGPHIQQYSEHQISSLLFK